MRLVVGPIGQHDSRDTGAGIGESGCIGIG
jgi:hypothetical protein